MTISARILHHGLGGELNGPRKNVQSRLSYFECNCAKRLGVRRLDAAFPFASRSRRDPEEKRRRAAALQGASR